MAQDNSSDFQDLRFMAAAVRLARRNLGCTAENPSVGALIIDEKRSYIIGCGVTEQGGRPHAEPQALAMAGDLARGATAYVTLEPCSHYGKTPPCVDTLIAAGIKRVVIALIDPDLRVAGNGIKRLEAAGIAVQVGVGADIARDGLSGYFCRTQNKRPEVMLKLAVSADGHIGKEGIGNVAITGPLSHAQTHIMRAENDAILVGINTALADDPMLDCRLPGMEQRSPIRVVLDSALKLPLTSQLVQSARQVPVWVFCQNNADLVRRATLENAQCRVIAMDDMRDLAQVLAFLGGEGINSLMVEGGAKVAQSFWDMELVDRLNLFQSPLIVGAQGYAAPHLAKLDENYIKVRSRNLGSDCCSEWKRII